MRKSCKWCQRTHAIGEECPLKPKRKTKPKLRTQQNTIRSSEYYKSVRKNVLERDHHLCRVCFFRKELHADALEVHHITPIEEAPERAYEESNLITLCREHHELAEAGVIPREKLYSIIKKDYSDIFFMAEENWKVMKNVKKGEINGSRGKAPYDSRKGSSGPG